MQHADRVAELAEHMARATGRNAPAEARELDPGVRGGELEEHLRALGYSDGGVHLNVEFTPTSGFPFRPLR